MGVCVYSVRVACRQWVYKPSSVCVCITPRVWIVVARVWRRSVEALPLLRLLTHTRPSPWPWPWCPPPHARSRNGLLGRDLARPRGIPPSPRWSPPKQKRKAGSTQLIYEPRGHPNAYEVFFVAPCEVFLWPPAKIGTTLEPLFLRPSKPPSFPSSLSLCGLIALASCAMPRAPVHILCRSACVCKHNSLTRGFNVPRTHAHTHTHTRTHTRKIRTPSEWRDYSCGMP